MPPAETGHKSVPRTNASAGFTLTELLVVMVILGLLAAAVTPQVIGRLDSSKVRAARLQMDTLGSALELYKVDIGTYPAETEGLAALLAAPPGATGWDGPYVRSARTVIDPWQRPFLFSVSGNRYVLRSLGADGAEGGSGHDADFIYPELGVQQN